MSARKKPKSPNLEKLIRSIGLPQAARRLHVPAVEIGKWRKRGVPKNRSKDLEITLLRHELAKRTAKARKKNEAIEALKREKKGLENTVERAKKLLRRATRKTYSEQIAELREKYILTPERSLRQLAKRFNVPLRSVYVDYHSPGFHGSVAA